MTSSITARKTGHLPPDLQELVEVIISGVLSLALKADWNSDSNSLGGILIHPLEGEMPRIIPKRKALFVKKLPVRANLPQDLIDNLLFYELPNFVWR